MNFLKYFMNSCFCCLTLQNLFSSQIQPVHPVHEDILQQATYKSLFNDIIPDNKLSSAIQYLLIYPLNIELNGQHLTIPWNKNIVAFMLGYDPNSELFQTAYDHADVFWNANENNGGFTEHIKDKAHRWWLQKFSARIEGHEYKTTSFFSTPAEKEIVQKRLTNILFLLTCDASFSSEYQSPQELAAFLGVPQNDVENVIENLLTETESARVNECRNKTKQLLAYIIHEQLKSFRSPSSQKAFLKKREKSPSFFQKRLPIFLENQSSPLLRISIPFSATLYSETPNWNEPQERQENEKQPTTSSFDTLSSQQATECIKEKFNLDSDFQEQGQIFQSLLQCFVKSSSSSEEGPISLNELQTNLSSRILDLLNKIGLPEEQKSEVKEMLKKSYDLIIADESSIYTFSPENIGCGLYDTKKKRKSKAVCFPGNSEDEFFVAACHEIGHFLEEQYPEDYALPDINENLPMLLELLAIQSLEEKKGQYFLQRRIRNFLSDYPTYLFIQHVLDNSPTVTAQDNETVAQWVHNSVENLFDTKEMLNFAQKIENTEILNSMKTLTEAKILSIFEKEGNQAPIFGGEADLPGFILALNLIFTTLEPDALLGAFSIANDQCRLSRNKILLKQKKQNAIKYLSVNLSLFFDND